MTDWATNERDITAALNNRTLGDHIAGSLRGIRNAWPDMILTGPKGQGGTPVRGSKEPPAPAPIAVLSLRREVAEMLASWCDLVMKDAVDINGKRMTVSLNSTDAASLAGWLLTWADFLGAHAAGEEAAAEIGKAAHDCANVAEGNHKRRFKVGACVEHGTSDMGERVPCTGTLYAYLAAGAIKHSTLICNADPSHKYESAEWMALGRRLTASA